MGLLGSVVSATAGTLNQQATNRVNYRIAEDTNKTNAKIAADTNDANLALAREQNDWNLRQWKRENDYNSPSQQLARLRQAGLSRAAAAQAISGGTASPLQSAELGNQQIGAPMQAPTMVAPDLSALSGLDIIGVARELQALKRDKMENEKISNELDIQPQMLMTELEAKQASLNLSKQQFANIAKSFPYSLKALQYETKIKKVDLVGKKLNNEQVEQNIKLTKQKFGFLEKMNDKELQSMDEQIRNLQKTGNQLDAQTQNIQASTENVKAQTDEVKASTENVKEQKLGIIAESKSKELEYILKRHGMPDSVAGRVGALVQSGKVTFNEVADALPFIKHYIHSGYREFNGDIKTRRFLQYIFDEGGSTSRQLGIHTIGGARDAADDVLDILK